MRYSRGWFADKLPLLGPLGLFEADETTLASKGGLFHSPLNRWSVYCRRNCACLNYSAVRVCEYTK